MKRVDREHYDGTKDWKNYYWYYYKGHILAIIGLILVITICTAQCASKVDPDYYVLFYSDVYIMDQVLDEITEEFAEISEDINGDGKVHVQAINCSYSEQDPSAMNRANQSAIMQIQSSDACIWVIDEAGVETFSDSSSMDIFIEDNDGKDYFVEASSLKNSNSFSNLVEDSGKEYYIFLRKSSDSKTVETGRDVLTKFIEKNMTK